MKILFVHMSYLLKRKDFFLKNSDYSDLYLFIRYSHS